MLKLLTVDSNTIRLECFMLYDFISEDDKFITSSVFNPDVPDGERSGLTIQLKSVSESLFTNTCNHFIFLVIS